MLNVCRQQASLLAVHNAKQKAQEMAKFVHQAVGKPICIQVCASTVNWKYKQCTNQITPTFVYQ